MWPFYQRSNDHQTSSHLATGNSLRHLKKKKKKLQETIAYCLQFGKKRGTYVGSSVVPTSSSLEMISVLCVFLPENCDEPDKVGAV